MEAVLAAESNAKKLMQMPSAWAKQLEDLRGDYYLFTTAATTTTTTSTTTTTTTSNESLPLVVLQQLYNTTCPTQVFFKNGEQRSKFHECSRIRQVINAAENT